MNVYSGRQESQRMSEERKNNLNYKGYERGCGFVEN